MGAEVFQDDNNDNTGDAAAKYTNSKGEALFTGLSGSTAGTVHSFFVNHTGVVGYENGVDTKRTVTVTSYVPVTTSLTPSSNDGAAFDVDENAPGDLTVLVKDQNQNPVNGQIIRYAWTITPFETTVGYPKTLAEASGTSTPDGKVSIPLPVKEPSGTYTLKSYVNRDGTPGQGPDDLAGTDLSVTVGQADIKWADDAVAQAQSGTTKSFAASLELEDGTTLAGRNIALIWTHGLGGDSVVSAQGAQPAGTNRTSDTSATSTTNASGGFAVALSDPAATPAVTELDGNLSAATSPTPNLGDAGDTSDLAVDFLRSVTPVDASDIIVSSDELIEAMATPGRPVDLDVTVENGDEVALTDFPVTVTVDHGFLSPNAEDHGDLEADPDEAQDGLYGEWKSVGTSADLSTDDFGDTGIVAAIEKDAAFDTSTSVITTVTIEAGSVTKTVPITFGSNNPLNGGDVKVERDDNQTVTVLPKAPTSESVKYNLFVTDQFGNLVDGETVAMTDDAPDATVTGGTSQLKNEGPALTLAADAAGDQIATGTWTTESSTWNDSALLTPGFQAERKNGTSTKTGDSETVQWYVVNYADSVYTMTHDGPDTRPVGSTAIMTYKAVDQNGEPISNLWTSFFRTGPDTYQDGDFKDGGNTGPDGMVSYVFAGAKAGTAKVEAISQIGSFEGDLVPESRAADQVRFAAPAPSAISARLTGSDNGAKADVVRVKAAKANGAVVRLYKVVNGVRKLVRTGTLNASGAKLFVAKDANGTKATKYVAVVSKTADTKADTSNAKWIR